MPEPITAEYLESKIADRQVTVINKKLTICVLVLESGFMVTGESKCADPAKFDEELGARIAFQNAMEKLAEMEAYHRAGLPEMIAKACHEANRAYCLAIGDDSQPAWEDAPEWQRTSAINGVMFHAANPDAGPSASHDAWLAEKRATGWKFGPVKDADKKEHPCFRPYDELPAEQRTKDYLFKAICHALLPKRPTAAEPSPIAEAPAPQLILPI